MDPLTIITTALALGAAAGARSTAEAAVKDVYTGLKSFLHKKLGKKSDTAKAIDRLETKPGSESRKAVLKEALEAAAVHKDQEALDKAAELLKRLEHSSPGATGGLVGQINAAGGRVVVVQGDIHGGFKM